MKNKRHDVLVLNKAGAPIQIIRWQRCMSLLVQEHAKPLDKEYMMYDLSGWYEFTQTHDDYVKIHTVRTAIAIPEIIILKTYDRLPLRDVKYSRQTVFQRDGNTCAYCGRVFNTDDLTIDHIVPRAQGGKSIWKNTISSCKPCNGTKADRTPEQSGMPLLFKPRQPTWIGPLQRVKDDHPCKSWRHFMNRISTERNISQDSI